MDELKKIRKIGFTVDAGLIQRLGYELVGRAETAVSELIKNSYYNRQIKKFPTEKQNVSLKHILT